MSDRFLVFGPSWLGDAVMALPTYHALRQSYPDSHISVVARGPVTDLYRAVSNVDNVIPYQRPAGLSRLAAYTRLVGQLQASRADTAIILPRSFGSAWTAILSDTTRRIGYASSGRSLILTDPVERTVDLLRVHRVRYLHHLLTPLGITGEPVAPQIPVLDDAKAAATDLLSPLLNTNPSKLVALNPGANYGSAKQWPEEKYVELSKQILGTNDVALVLVGAPGDHPACQNIATAIDDPRVLDLSGRTSVSELAAVLARSDFAVTNDTGAMHVAAAVGTRVLAIFGPTDPVTTPPFGEEHMVIREPVECSPCLLRECPIDHRCMTRIDVERVLAPCQELLRESHPSRT